MFINTKKRTIVVKFDLRLHKTTYTLSNETIKIHLIRLIETKTTFRTVRILMFIDLMRKKM